LLGEDTDADTQRWATEGYAYLTLDADVKVYFIYFGLFNCAQEYVVSNLDILRAILRLCTDGGKPNLPLLIFAPANLWYLPLLIFGSHHSDRSVHYSVANMLVNLGNAYDMPEETEERKQMKKLGKSSI
jgi:hypothetical protein